MHCAANAAETKTILQLHHHVGEYFSSANGKVCNTGESNEPHCKVWQAKFETSSGGRVGLAV